MKELETTSLQTIYKGLNAICKCLDTLYNINYGGCCYIAYCIAELLEKDNIPFEIIVFEEYDEDFNELPEACEHIAINIINEDWLIINKADYDLEEYTTYKNVTSSDLLNYYKRNRWNSLYNVFKNKFIKYIIKLLYENFTSSLRKRGSNSSSK